MTKENQPTEDDGHEAETDAGGVVPDAEDFDAVNAERGPFDLNDDEECGHRYRLAQARKMIRSFHPSVT